MIVLKRRKMLISQQTTGQVTCVCDKKAIYDL